MLTEDEEKNEPGRFRLSGPLLRTRAGKRKKIKAGPIPTGKAIRASRDNQGTYAVFRGKKTYLVAPELVAELGFRVKSARMIQGVDAAQHPCVIMIFDSTDSWSESMRELIEVAYDEWIVVGVDRDTTSFVSVRSDEDLDDPDWESLPSLDDMVEEAFAGRMIETADDPRLLE